MRKFFGEASAFMLWEEEVRMCAAEERGMGKVLSMLMYYSEGKESLQCIA